MIFDETDYPPPPPIYFLPPPPREYVNLPPPRFANPGFLPIPVPVFLPSARPWRGDAYRQPQPVRLPVGVVAAAHHGAYGGMLETHGVGLGLEHREGVRVHVALDGQVAGRGRQVLAQRQHFDAVRPHVAHDVQDFIVGFTQSDHQAALGRHVGEQRLEFLQQVQAELVIAAGPGFLVQTRHGLQVVVHDIGRCGFQDVEGAVVAAAEIGYQDFDLGAG